MAVLYPRYTHLDVSAKVCVWIITYCYEANSISGYRPTMLTVLTTIVNPYATRLMTYKGSAGIVPLWHIPIITAASSST